MILISRNQNLANSCLHWTTPLGIIINKPLPLDFLYRIRILYADQLSQLMDDGEHINRKIAVMGFNSFLVSISLLHFHYTKEK